jgi:hypothetical protein
MATQTLANFDAMLKEDYGAYASELLQEDTYLIDQVQKKSPDDLDGVLTKDPFREGGRRLIFPVHTSRNRGRGAMSDGGTLSTAGRQGFLDAIVSMRYRNQAVELTDILTKHAQGNNSGAFASAVTTEIDGAIGDLKKDTCRECYGTGDGLLATVSAASGPATTVAVDSGQYIAVGDTVDILTKSTGAVKLAGTVVTAVSYTGAASSSTQANATITVGSVTVTTADGIYIAGNRNLESDGLRNMFATSSRTLHGIDSSTNTIWNPALITPKAFAAAAEDDFLKVAQAIRGNGRGKPNLGLTTMGISRRLANSYVSAKRYNDAKATQLDTGYSAIMVSAGPLNFPVIDDVDCANGFAFIMDQNNLAWAELAKPGWLTQPNGTGTTSFLKTGSTAGTYQAVWQSWYVWYATMVTVATNKGGALTGCADDIPFSRI